MFNFVMKKPTPDSTPVPYCQSDDMEYQCIITPAVAMVMVWDQNGNCRYVSGYALSVETLEPLSRQNFIDSTPGPK